MYHCATPVMYLRITGQIHVPAYRKNLTFPNYEFGKGQYAFYPIKLSCFAKKIKFIKIPKFHKGGPLQTPLNQKISKVKHYFGGF